MRYHVLATDYDGTLAHDGRVDDATVAALRRLRESGRRLVLVTGRELLDLQNHFSSLDLFDRVVAENGALIYRPMTKDERVLASPPPPAFLDELKRRGVNPVSVGRVIVATWEPHQTAVLDAIRRLGLELQVIFNKGAVMVLPGGVNKATGLTAALEELGYSPHNAVGIGDAENDHAFLARCECAVAVTNALPSLKERADWVTRGDHGAGVVELIQALLGNDLAGLDRELGRHAILLGRHADGAEVRVPPYGVDVLVAGTSGSGKSTLTKGLLERLSAAGYQYAIIDPEGDYEGFEGALTLGDPRREPLPDEVLNSLETAGHNVVVNLLGVPLEQRPAFFDGLLPRLHELRTRTGRPHWLVVDEAHHLLPTTWTRAGETLPRDLGSALFITVHPESAPSSAGVGRPGPGGGRQAGGNPRGIRQGRGQGAPEGQADGTGAGGDAGVAARVGAGEGQERAAAGRAPPPLTQVRRGKRRPGPQLYVPRPGRQVEFAGAEPGAVPANGRRRRRRDLAVSPRTQGVFCLVPGSHQGRRAGH
jgi:hydroxymethylpyrimidine pyrophosphatase-like HAD family hydrolase